MKIILLVSLTMMWHMVHGQTLTTPTTSSDGATYSLTIKADTIPHSTEGGWDFSIITTDETGTVEFQPISSTSYSTSYPNATHVKYEDDGMFFLGFDSSAYTFHGEMSAITTSYSNPLALHKYPFAVGDTKAD